MPANAPQLELLAGKEVEPISWEIQIELARRCKSRKDALRKCFEASNLDPKQVYGPLGIPQPNFTKMMNGQAFMDPDVVPQFMRLCGNIIPVHYDALRENCELVPVKTSLEQENEALRTEVAELNKRIAWLAQMLRGAQ